MRIWPKNPVVLSATLAAGAMALVGGSALILHPSTSSSVTPGIATGQNTSLTSTDCSNRETKIKERITVPTKDVLVCDRDEFAALERTRPANGHVVISSICLTIADFVKADDRFVPPAQAELCRNRELFALKSDTANGISTKGLALSMCVGKKLLQKNHRHVPAYMKNACTHNEFGTKPLSVSTTSSAGTNPGPSTSPTASPITGPCHVGIDKNLIDSNATSAQFPKDTVLTLTNAQTYQSVDVTVGAAATTVSDCLDVSPGVFTKLGVQGESTDSLSIVVKSKG